MTGRNELKGRNALDAISIFLATGLYLSLIPLKLFRALPVFRAHATEKWSGCGLMGSLLGVATYLLLPARLAASPWMLLGGVVLAIVVSARAERAMGVHDDTRIVIDEWIGAWIAATGVAPEFGWGIVAAFVLFRIFDVWKGPFGFLQRLPGGWGVTMDDVAAGVASCVILRLIPVN